jgi:aspartyl protease family protein
MRIWLLVFFAIGLMLLLKWQFPYAASDTDQQLRIVYLIAMLILIGGGSRLLSRMTLSQAARDMFLWLAIILLLVFGYSFRHELKNNRIFAELVPARVQQTEEGAMSVQSSEDGHFHIEAEVNGVLIDFLVDTGASDIVLSQHDAQAAGYYVVSLNYNHIHHTANGIVSTAPISIKKLVVGSIVLHDLPASVNKVPMEESLLGMTFLNQMKSYSVDGNRLTLTP